MFFQQKYMEKNRLGMKMYTGMLPHSKGRKNKVIHIHNLTCIER